MNNRREIEPNDTIYKLLTEALEHDDAKKMEQLIDDHPLLNNEFKMGSKTPLVVYAADHGSEKIIRLLLLKKGFDAKATSSDNRNALVSCSLLNPYFPRHEERIRIATLLLTMGLNVNSSTSVGSTPLQLAALGNLSKLVELLLDHGAAVNQSDYVNRTPLELIYDQGTPKEEVVGALVDAGSLIPEQYKNKVHEHYIANVLDRVGLFKDSHSIILDYVRKAEPNVLSRHALG